MTAARLAVRAIPAVAIGLVLHHILGFGGLILAGLIATYLFVDSEEKEKP